ncbi:hypothetical protein D3C87_1545700 [compost metagenome]
MLLHQCGDRIVGFLASPVALPFEQDLLPGDGYDASLHHAVHCIFVRIGRGAAGSVGDHVDFVLRNVMQSRECKGRVADFGPQTGDDNLLAAVGSILCQRIAYVLIIPGVHRGAFKDVILRIDGQKFGEGVAGEALGLNRGNRGWHVENLGSLGQANDVVLQGLAVDRLNAECHLRLLVDEDELAVGGGKNFKLGHVNSSSVVLDRECGRL